MTSWILRLSIAISLLFAVFSVGSQIAVADETNPLDDYDWSGVHIGGHLGGVHVRDKLVGNFTGFAGGVLGGYSHQFDNNIVLGVEADAYWGDLIKKGSIFGFDGTKKINWGSTIRLRAGYAFNDWLVFASAGFAKANVSVKGSNPFLSVKDTKTHNGYVLSAGVEKAVSENWRLRAEYTYGKFGGKTYSLGPLKKRLKGSDGHGVRMALSYRFNLF